MSAIQKKLVRVSLVIASDCQCREEPGTFFRIQAEVVKGVELYPVDFHGSGRCMTDETFIFAIYFYVKLTYASISGVPCDSSAFDRLVRVAGWNRVRTGGQNGLCRWAVPCLSVSAVTPAEAKTDRHHQNEAAAVHVT